MKMLAPETKDPTNDVCVRAGRGWKALLQAQRNGQQLSQMDSLRDGADDPYSAGGLGTVFVGRRHSHTSLNSESDPSQALIAQKEEILWLWRDSEVRKTLKKRGVPLEDLPGL
jgi:guanine nucleotide-binding protein subunit alpha